MIDEREKTIGTQYGVNRIVNALIKQSLLLAWESFVYIFALKLNWSYVQKLRQNLIEQTAHVEMLVEITRYLLSGISRAEWVKNNLIRKEMQNVTMEVNNELAQTRQRHT